MMPTLKRIVLVAMCAAISSCAADSVGDNLPPELQFDVPPDIEWTAGDGIIRVTVTGQDPEGGPIELDIARGPDRADFRGQGSSRVFTWDPLPQDVTPSDAPPTQVVFVAEDQRGARAEKVLNITVLAGNGIPRFQNENSILHNVGSGQPVAFDVTVRDDDSSSVSIRMPAGLAPEGADFTKTGDFGGRFAWQPNDEQLARRVHTVKFVADDGQNEPVEQDVTIILKKSTTTDPGITPGNSECEWEQYVSYDSLGAQRDTGDYRITATLTTAGAAVFEKLVLNYTNGDVNDLELEWQSTDMAKSGDTFAAAIPNPILGEGQTETYFWEICAIDEDESSDDLPSVYCGPTSLYESFIAYAPDADACVGIPATELDFDFARSIEKEWSTGKSCEGGSEVWELGLGTQQEARVFVIYPSGQAPLVEVYDENQTLESTADSLECTGMSEIILQNTGAPTKKFIEVSGTPEAPDTPYHVVGYVSDTTDDASCADSSFEPNGTVAEATEIMAGTSSFNQMEICRSNDVDVYSFDLEIGQTIDVVASFTHTIGDIDMTLFSPGQEDSVGSDGFGVALAWGISDEETISYTATEAGTHWLVVYTVDNPNRYSLSFDISADVSQCVDNDIFEPNDTQQQAKVLPEQRSESIDICSNTEDWYSFLVLEWQLESFVIELEATNGSISDLEFEVWDLFGSVTAGRLENGKLVADFFPFTNGDHYVRVKSTGDVSYAATLSVNFSI